MKDKATREEPAIRHHSSHWGAFIPLVENGRLIGARKFDNDPEPSPIIHSMADSVHGSSRVAGPMVRQSWLRNGPGANTGARGAEPFIPVSWDKALKLVAEELERVRSRYGNEALYGGSYGWASAGRFHHASTHLWRFLNTLGGFTDDVHNYSVAAGLAIIPHVLGSVQFIGRPSGWDGIVSHTRLMLLFGGMPLRNAQVSPGGIAEHTTPGFLRRARRAGVRFINISPLRSDAPDFLEAEWLPIRPNTDTALMLALAHCLVSEGLHDRAFLADYCTGFEQFEAYLLGGPDGVVKNAEWAAAITEISPGTIRALARDMAGTRTLINTNYSLQRGDHGEQPYWMTVVLAGLLGQIGLPGGGFGLGMGSMGNRGNPKVSIPSPNLSRGTNPVKSWIPVARIADMLLHPGAPYDFNGERRVYPDIKLVYWCGGNPFHHHQDLNRLRRGWRHPETVIVQDPWWTATARHADIVLPATTTLERDDIGACSDDRYIMAMQQAIAPVGGARNDYAIFRQLAEIMGTKEAFTEGKTEGQWLRTLYGNFRDRAALLGVELPGFEAFWEKGYAELPRRETPYVMLSDFREDSTANALATPSGRIEIYSEKIAGFGYADCPGHPVWLEPAEWLGAAAVARFPLHLLSSQPAHRLHGQFDDGRLSRENKIKGREPMLINSQDAGARGIASGDVVRVYNARGALLAGAIVTAEIRPGVVQLPTGAWYDPLDPGAEMSLEKHGNPNVLTLDKGTSRLGQAPVAQSVLVEIERFNGELPAITAFEPPPQVDEDS